MAATKHYVSQTKTILLYGTLLGVLIAGLAAWSAMRDNSKRTAAEESFHKSEEKYRKLIDGIHDHAIFMLDPQGRVASWNAGAERIKGYTAEEIIGHHCQAGQAGQDAPESRRKRRV
jgi:PAS domain-containing protein